MTIDSPHPFPHRHGMIHIIIMALLITCKIFAEDPVAYVIVLTPCYNDRDGQEILDSIIEFTKAAQPGEEIYIYDSTKERLSKTVKLAPGWMQSNQAMAIPSLKPILGAIKEAVTAPMPCDGDSIDLVKTIVALQRGVPHPPRGVAFLGTPLYAGKGLDHRWEQYVDGVYRFPTAGLITSPTTVSGLSCGGIPQVWPGTRAVFIQSRLRTAVRDLQQRQLWVLQKTCEAVKWQCVSIESSPAAALLAMDSMPPIPAVNLSSPPGIEMVDEPGFTMTPLPTPLPGPPKLQTYQVPVSGGPVMVHSGTSFEESTFKVPGAKHVRLTWDNYTIPDAYTVYTRFRTVLATIPSTAGKGERIIDLNGSDSITVAVNTAANFSPGTSFTYSVEALPY